METTTVNFKRTNLKIYKNIYRKSFIQLSDMEKEQTVFSIMSKHFRRYNSIERTTQLWNIIYEYLRHQIFTQFDDKIWYPENINELLKF